jgi:hypothetical protein
VDPSRRGGDSYLATTGDLHLATSGDFFMAMDMLMDFCAADGREVIRHGQPRPPPGLLACVVAEGRTSRERTMRVSRRITTATVKPSSLRKTGE